MRLLVLHGPAINSSRQKLLEIKKGFNPDNITVFEKTANKEDILASLQTESLFEGEQLIVLENPISFDLSLVTSHPSLTLVLWFDKEIDTKKFREIEILFFPEGKEISIFPFLRMLGTKDKKAYLELNKLKIAGFESQYFITMILYLLRNLIATPKKAADFVKQNNIRMRKNFTNDDLVNLYKRVLEIDFKIKNGLMEASQADHSLVSNFLR